MIRPVAALRLPTVAVITPLIAAALSALVLTLPAPPTHADPADTATVAVDEVDPLTMTIDSMTPTTIPKKGTVTLSGSVTNDSADLWRNIKVYPRLSYSPLTTTAEVDLAAESDPRLPFGDRITSEGHFDSRITRLEPGQSQTWSIRIPHDVLAARISGTEGTYQIGVQALGASDKSGRPENAVGRARTFIPLMGAGHPKVVTSIVVPVRGQVSRHPDGRIAHEARWNTELAPGGRLSRLVDLVRGADEVPVTWAIDPAILSAAAQLAKGNPARDLGQPKDEGADEGPDPDEATTDTLVPSDPARTWLNDITSLTGGNEVLGLPYGDLDIAAASVYDRTLYEQARDLSDAAFEDLKISSRPGVAPPSGLLPPDAVDLIEPDAAMVMSTEAIPGETDSADEPSRLQFRDHTMSLFDPSLTSLPEGETSNMLTMRQRVLAEASVLSLSGDQQTLVVNFPTDFDPGASAGDFFKGLSRPFLDLRRLSANTTGSTRTVTDLDYPHRQEVRELTADVITAAQALITAGVTLDNILMGTETLAPMTAEEAMTYASYMARDDQDAAVRSAQESTSWLKDHLDKVTINAPSFVILSAATGRFAVKITNGLDVPVTLALVAHTTDDLVVKAPPKIEVEANASRTIQLDATSKQIGVHPVELVAADLDGHPLGSSEQVSVRANSVGKVIWVILGVGVGILFLAIPVRLYRRVRKSKAA